MRVVAAVHWPVLGCPSPECADFFAPNFDPGACNGRKSLMPILHSAKPVDLVIIALGVNDLKWRFSATPADIANGAGLLAADIQLSGATEIHPSGPALKEGAEESASSAPKVLLLCPPPITNEYFFPDFRGGGAARSRELAAEFDRVASSLGSDVAWLDGGAVEGVQCSEVDGIHLTAAAHEALGKAVVARVEAMLADCL